MYFTPTETGWYLLFLSHEPFEELDTIQFQFSKFWTLSFWGFLSLEVGHVISYFPKFYQDFKFVVILILYHLVLKILDETQILEYFTPPPLLLPKVHLEDLGFLNIACCYWGLFKHISAKWILIINYFQLSHNFLRLPTFLEMEVKEGYELMIFKILRKFYGRNFFRCLNDKI